MNALLEKEKRIDLFNKAVAKGWTLGSIALAIRVLPPTLDAIMKRDSKKGAVGRLDRFLLENADKSPADHASKAAGYRASEAAEPYGNGSAHVDKLVKVLDAALPVLRDQGMDPLDRLNWMEVNLKAALALAPSIRAAILRDRETRDDLYGHLEE